MEIIWHDSSEAPSDESKLENIISDILGYRLVILTFYLNYNDQYIDTEHYYPRNKWDDFVKYNKIIAWTYEKDIIPNNIKVPDKFINIKIKPKKCDPGIIIRGNPSI